MATSKLVREWLSEYKALPEAELNTYSNTIRHNQELVHALHNVFSDGFSQEVVDPVCHQLFEFYRSGLPELRRFTLELLPKLIHVYLSSLSYNDKKKCGGIEACLLGIYNLEIVNKDGSPRVDSCTIPTLAVPSIYHEPPSLATLALTESALLRFHSDEPVVISIGPLPPVESFNAQNRLSVLTKVLSCYNMDIAKLSPQSHGALCKMAIRLTSAGFDSLGSTDSDSFSLNDSWSSTSSSRGPRRGVRFLEVPRIPLSSAFLVELLNGIYFVMFNGKANEGIEACEAIHTRASYELYADVLLVTNAIKNSLLYNPSGQPEDGPMGISVALSPTASNPTFSKNAITNASFRAKKLPEDIEVPDGNDDTSQQGPPPEYNELFESGDRTKLEAEKIKSGMKLAKPLKGIMKKADKMVHRRESDRKRDSGESHSPRNSGVPPGAANIPLSMSLNGDITGGEGNASGVRDVQVCVTRGGSRTMLVDVMELKNLDGIQHKRSSSNPEDCSNYESIPAQTTPPPTMPLLEGSSVSGRASLNSSSHSHDLRAALNRADSSSSNGSFNTPL